MIQRQRGKRRLSENLGKCYREMKGEDEGKERREERQN